MTTETINLMRRGRRVFVSGCGESTWVGSVTGKRYFDMLEVLDPAYISLSNGATFEVEERAAYDFITGVMAPAPIKYEVPMRNAYDRYPRPD